jgi:hypothetical protein
MRFTHIAGLPRSTPSRSASCFSAQAARVDGSIAIVFAPCGKLSQVLRFTISDGRIAKAEIVREPAHRDRIDLALV